jgi:signal transduction histidine kinase
MKLSRQPLYVRAIDMGYLSMLVALTAVGFVVTQMAAKGTGAAPDIPGWGSGFYFLLVESFLLLWAVSKASGCRTPLTTCVFTLRIQAQAAMQVYLAGFIVALSIVGLLYAAKWLGASQDAFESGLPELILRVNRFWVLVCPLATVWLATWRLNALNNSGYQFADIHAGALNRAQLVVSAPAGIAANRLEHYLDALQSMRTPVLPILYYGERPVVSRHVADGSPVYELTWRWCPSKICITICIVPDAGDKPVSTVVMTCRLRAGFYRYELFTNPREALVLMTYMQANVLQLLGSELALSASTARQDALRNQALDMQLRILQAQIEPHFLFNTLASVRHLYRSSTEAGELMMDHVITYLRCAMQELRSDASTVGKELDLVLHYLAIMKIRMGERLSYSFIHTEDVANRAFPPAMLISLVENAIKHGLNDRADGKLTISAVREGQGLRVTVLDNGPGFSSLQGTGVGLSNIRQRLEAIYGKRAWLEVGALASGGFIASIVVPIENVDEMVDGGLA